MEIKQIQTDLSYGNWKCELGTFDSLEEFREKIGITKKTLDLVSVPSNSVYADLIINNKYILPICDISNASDKLNNWIKEMGRYENRTRTIASQENFD